jgi:hypothetical protein
LLVSLAKYTYMKRVARPTLLRVRIREINLRGCHVVQSLETREPHVESAQSAMNPQMHKIEMVNWNYRIFGREGTNPTCCSPLVVIVARFCGCGQSQLPWNFILQNSLKFA